jgi:hypothetical protein
MNILHIESYLVNPKYKSQRHLSYIIGYYSYVTSNEVFQEFAFSIDVLLINIRLNIFVDATFISDNFMDDQGI